MRSQVMSDVMVIINCICRTPSSNADNIFHKKLELLLKRILSNNNIIQYILKPTRKNACLGIIALI